MILFAVVTVNIRGIVSQIFVWLNSKFHKMIFLTFTSYMWSQPKMLKGDKTAPALGAREYRGLSNFSWLNTNQRLPINVVHYDVINI